jgi:hypothetical protein
MLELNEKLQKEMKYVGIKREILECQNLIQNLKNNEFEKGL